VLDSFAACRLHPAPQRWTAASVSTSLRLEQRYLHCRCLKGEEDFPPPLPAHAVVPPQAAVKGSDLHLPSTLSLSSMRGTWHI